MCFACCVHDSILILCMPCQVLDYVSVTLSVFSLGRRIAEAEMQVFLAQVTP